MSHSEEPRRADFSERALAFTVDYALAAKGVLGNVHHVSLAVRF